jgi:hypothetical protein
MKLQLRLLILGILSLDLVACGTASTISAPTTIALQPETLPTATPTIFILMQSEEPDIPEPGGGEVEIHIPFDIYSQSEMPSADIPECVNTIPFRIIKDELKSLIEGQGPIACEFVDTPEGAPITFHVVLELNGVLNGEVLPATPDKPSGWLDGHLALDGEIIQFYTDYPPEATNPCPEDNPCRITTFETIPLPFDKEEGSTITIPWTFILHLQ